MVAVGRSARSAHFLLQFVGASGYRFYSGQDPTAPNAAPPPFSFPLQIRIGALFAPRGFDRISPVFRVNGGGECDLPTGGFAVSSGVSIGLRLPGISILKRDPAVGMQILATGLLSYQWDILLEPRGMFTGGAISLVWDIDSSRIGPQPNP